MIESNNIFGVIREMDRELMELFAVLFWAFFGLGFFCAIVFGIRSYFLGGIKSKDKNLKQLIIEAIVEASLEIEKRNRADDADTWEEVEPIKPISLE